MSSPSQPDEKLWTPANVVTLARICGVPVFVMAIISPWPAWIPDWTDAVLWKPWVAAGIFILLAATDGLDGYLARSRGEVTTFGKFIDPLADKILVAAALLALTELQVLPSWVALVILCREFIVSGIRMVAAAQGTVIAASWYGKFKTVFQIIAIVLFIIKDSLVANTPDALDNPLYLVSWAVMFVALVLTVVSMLDYFAKARHLLGFARKGEAEAGASQAAPAQGAAGTAEQDACGEAPADVLAQGACAPDAAELERLAGEVLAAARRRGMALATAESLTGGLIAATLTAVPGSSDVVQGGVVSYSNNVKQGLLGVDGELLGSVGAVSREVACAMAEGALRDTGADVAVSVTGIAGPGGAEPGKPVGTVWIGVAGPAGTQASRQVFPGSRSEVRAATVKAALDAFASALG